MKKSKIKYIFQDIALLIALFPVSGFAEESTFGYVYTTDMLPAHQKEILQAATLHEGKAGGDFSMEDGKTTAEYGLSDRLQLGASVSYAHVDANHNGASGATEAPAPFAGSLVAPGQRLAATAITGLSATAIYRITSPYVDPIGSALVVEPSIGKNVSSVELRAVLQKNYMDDRLIMAANLAVIPQSMWLPDGVDRANYHSEHGTDLNAGIGVSYRFMEAWSAGFEALNERQYGCFCLSSGGRAASAYFLGPMIHYGGEKYFLTATALEQLPLGSDFANPPPGDMSGGRNLGPAFEKYRLRLKAGYYF